MKNYLAVLLCMIFLLGSLSGCIGNDESMGSSTDESDDSSPTDSGSDTDSGSNNTTGTTDTTNSTDSPPVEDDSPYDVICPDGTNETIQWGNVTCATPVAFKAADVSNETLNLTLEWYNIASAEWGNFGPVEIYVIGNDVDAAKDLEDVFCERHKALDENWNEEWDCANENYEIFTRYTEDGGAAISTFKRTYIEYDFMMMIMSAKYPGPEEDDYKPVTLHEYFHIYQHSHINDECTGDSRDSCERDAKMVGKANHGLQKVAPNSWLNLSIQSRMVLGRIICERSCSANWRCPKRDTTRKTCLWTNLDSIHKLMSMMSAPGLLPI